MFRAPNAAPFITCRLGSSHGGRTLPLAGRVDVYRGAYYRGQSGAAADAAMLADNAEVELVLASLVLVSMVVADGPFFPATLNPGVSRADVRRCAVGPVAAQSDCALIHEQWVVTTADAVASARPAGGRLHVRIGDEDYAVDQLVYHPKWNGGAKHGVALLRLTERVHAFPLLPAPGEFPAHTQRVIARAGRDRAWVAHTIGGSVLWSDDRTCPVPEHRQSALVARVRAFLDGWSARAED